MMVGVKNIVVCVGYHHCDARDGVIDRLAHLPNNPFTIKPIQLPKV